MVLIGCRTHPMVRARSRYPVSGNVCRDFCGQLLLGIRNVQCGQVRLCAYRLFDVHFFYFLFFYLLEIRRLLPADVLSRVYFPSQSELLSYFESSRLPRGLFHYVARHDRF